MTIERAIYCFGLRIRRSPLGPNDIVQSREVEPSFFKDEVPVQTVKVLTPDTIRRQTYTVLSRYRFVFPHSRQTYPIKKILTGEEINNTNIQFSLFPGIKERIIWKP